MHSLKCPFCESILSKVVDKRTVSGRGEVRRRRECLKCTKRFTTYETLAKLNLIVIKKDGRRQLYIEDKLRSGLIKALEKRPGIDKVENIISRIETRIKEKGLNEVPTSLIGRWVLSDLKKIDRVAYLRFASVYRTFTDPKDFEKELKGLI